MEDRDRWVEADEIFTAALDRPESERSEFVLARCGDDVSLLAFVQELLAAANDTSFLGVPPEPDVFARALSGGPPTQQAGEDPLLESRVGPYRIVRLLGSGGMGAVYLAAREEPFEALVALKTLRRGIDTDDIVQRFLSERQILAQLEHPNIARLLDGGTTADGRPYFVLEYVKGEPITMWASRGRLDLHARLRLLRTVAEALQHAHRHLVVHRDLKPSNVFVSHEGRPKLLDFGIARLVGEDLGGSARTRTGLRFLTPAYAAPEQVRGEPTTTATDVYQWGALAYELLSGARPFDPDLPQPELERRIVAEDPLRLSAAARNASVATAGERGFSSAEALGRALRDDLDVVVAKAMAKEPEQRYGSMEALSQDLTRVLERRPILARPPSWSYRLGRLVHRHRWLGPATAALLATIALFGVNAVRYERQLRTERDAAEEHARRAEAVTDFLAETLNGANPWAGGGASDITLTEVLEGATARVESEFAGSPEIQARLFEVIAASHHVAERYHEATRLRRRAFSLERHRLGEEATPTLVARARLGASLTYASGAADGDAELEPVLAALGQAEDPERARLAAWTLHLLGNSRQWASELDSALVLMEAADRRFTALRPEAAALHGALLADYSRLWREAGRAPDSAVVLAERGVAALASVLPAGHLELAEARIDLAGALSSAGRLEEALARFDEVVPVFEERLAPDHPSMLAVLNNRALTLGALGREEEAVRVLETIERRLAASAEPSLERRAANFQNLAALLHKLGHSDRAVAAATEAQRMYRELFDEHYLQAFPLLTIAEIELDRGRYREAWTRATAAERILERTLPAGHYAWWVARCRAARAQDRLGVPAARPALREAAMALEGSSLDPEHPYVRECREAAGETTTGGD